MDINTGIVNWVQWRTSWLLGDKILLFNIPSLEMAGFYTLFLEILQKKNKRPTFETHLLSGNEQSQPCDSLKRDVIQLYFYRNQVILGC